MNKQRKVLIIITYNEMGIIIDTKAEEVAQPNLQPTCNKLATDYISRQAAIGSIENVDWYHINQNGDLVSGANSQEHEPLYKASEIYAAFEKVPSADVVEVVRCRDCARYDSHNNRCKYWNHGVGADLNGYCSKGERRTDGEIH